MTRLASRIRDAWRKNGPELIGAASRGFPSFVLMPAGASLRDGVPVFCYHQVEPAWFERHLRFLRDNGYESVNADDLLDYLRNQRRLRQRSVLLTFDDGLSSLHTTAYPLLQRYGQRATAFIAPAFHDHGPESIAAGTCTWDQIAEMHASGVIDFQSHTLEHRLVHRWPMLAPLTGMAERQCASVVGPPRSMLDDLVAARTAIETRLNKRVRHLAFPQYEGTARAIEIGRRAGYEAFYWGVRSGRPSNREGQSPEHIVRISGEFVRRLPGAGRAKLAAILRDRFRGCSERRRTRTRFENQCTREMLKAPARP